VKVSELRTIIKDVRGIEAQEMTVVVRDGVQCFPLEFVSLSSKDRELILESDKAGLI
jgi:hypothetical protein